MLLLKYLFLTFIVKLINLIIKKLIKLNFVWQILIVLIFKNYNNLYNFVRTKFTIHIVQIYINQNQCLKKNVFIVFIYIFYDSTYFFQNRHE